MDGVLTDTASTHARAWKKTFDEFLERARRVSPLSTSTSDYKAYVDGKTRYDGVRDFLASRGIELPEGTPDDPAEAETVAGVGNRKNELVQRLIAEEGVDVYEGSRALRGGGAARGAEDRGGVLERQHRADTRGGRASATSSTRAWTAW